MAVTDNDDVLVASTAWGATTASSSANSRCLTSSFSTMASTTSAQGARSVTVLASDTRARYAACISGVSLFLATSFCQVSASAVPAASAAPGRRSKSRTWLPAWTAIWAMPRPMAPVPTIPTVGKIGCI
ncbi:hypothetical protein Y695_03073 [Hydrogenophaga sp. T4]|nr:hypothetical protein Y695_03073 [Hydrogenophaga sp. T4]